MKLTVNQLRELIKEQMDEPEGSDDDAGDYGKLSSTERQARWQSKRPNISHLKAGISDEGKPLFKKGDRIVVDRRTSMLPNSPWLETIVGRVKSIDPTKGIVSVFDDESDPRSPRVRYVSYVDGLHDIKLAPAKGDPFAGAGGAEPKPEKPAEPKSPLHARKTYRIYGKKGGSTAHTRLQGKAFLAPQGTRFNPGDDARIAPEDGKLRVTGVDDDRSQLWEPEE